MKAEIEAQRKAPTGSGVGLARLVGLAVRAGLTLAGCGQSGPPPEPPAPSPSAPAAGAPTTPDPSPSDTALPPARDGSNVAACQSGNCQVEVSAPTEFTV